ncbi:hypothetical protein K4F52_010325, partial [Lecanicillium sp. MT-2017a]
MSVSSDSHSEAVDDGATAVNTTPPSLFPCYFPSKAQLVTLITAQGILEDCSFDFARKWRPSLILEKQWDSAAAVSLDEWIRIFETSGMVGALRDANVSIDCLLRLLPEMQKLSEAVVNRARITARGISQLLHHAQNFAKLLGDEGRAVTVNEIKNEVDGGV